MNIALKVNAADNVATIFANNVKKGDSVEVRDNKGEKEQITVLSDIPYGHKIALCDIEKGCSITKYGEEIGVASRNIVKGDYVHVHNLDSMRGRGDLDTQEVRHHEL